MSYSERLGTVQFREQLQAAFRRLTYTIPAGSQQKIDFTGTYLKVVSASVLVSDIELEIDQSGRWNPEAGLEYQFLPNAYKRVTIYNNNAAPQTVVILLGLGDCRDPGTVTTITGTVTLARETTLTTVADVNILAAATTLVLAANALRRGAFISNLQANGTVVRYGDVNTGAARGAEIPIGGTAYVEDTAAIYVYNPSGAAINIGVTFTAA